jgi:hypothetical protein
MQKNGLSNEIENYGNVLIFVTFVIFSLQHINDEKKMFGALSLVAEENIFHSTNMCERK